MAQPNSPCPHRVILGIFAILLAATFIYWIMQPYHAPLPPAIPAIPTAHQAPAAVAPPKGLAVGKPVMAAIKAHQKDVKNPANP